MTEKIDFVLYWVDGNDPEWQAEKRKYLPGSAGNDQQTNGSIRYRDWDLLRYWFRGVEKFAPWVNRVYFVTCGHVPEWLDLSCEKLKFVRHDEFIPREYLPTFSANPIELNFHRLPDLQERFVVFNDDMFVVRPVKESAFFKNGLPRDIFVQSFCAPVRGAEVMNAIVYNDTEILVSHYDRNTAVKKAPLKFFSPLYGRKLLRNLYALPLRFTGLASQHSACSYLKSTFENVWARDHDRLHQTCLHRFRSKEDVNQWLLAWDQVMRGEFEPMNPNLRKYYTIGNDNAVKGISKQSADVICLNDGDPDADFEFEKERLQKAFESILPEKSSFEKG